MKWHICMCQQLHDWPFDTTRILQYQSDMGSVKKVKQLACFIRDYQNAVDTNTHTVFPIYIG